MEKKNEKVVQKLRGKNKKALRLMLQKAKRLHCFFCTVGLPARVSSSDVPKFYRLS